MIPSTMAHVLDADIVTHVGHRHEVNQTLSGYFALGCHLRWMNATDERARVRSARWPGAETSTVNLALLWEERETDTEHPRGSVCPWPGVANM